VPIRHKDALPEDELYAPISWQSAADYGDLLYEKADGIAKISINRPEVHNAFRPQTLIELSAALELAREDPEVGVVILTGQGEDAFCTSGSAATPAISPKVPRWAGFT
jgi:naphthoate synthase